MNRTEFPRVTPESVGIPSGAVERLLDKLESGFTEPHGLMIMRHGKVCAEGWWSPYAPGIRHGLQSLTKTYAATAVGIAFTEGLLTLEDRIIDIFPDEAPSDPSENLKLLTVRDVLCMGNGMDTMPRPSKDWIREFLHTPVAHKPGTTYMYNSMGSSMLGAIVRKLTGLGLHDYLKPRLFDKIGIDADNLRWYYLPDGMEIGGGGLFSTTENNLRLMKLYADGGVWNGDRILSEEYVKRATVVQNESATESKGNPDAKDNFLGYGFQMWMCTPKDVYRADGAMGQFSIVFPHHDMILSINETAAGALWAQTTLDVIWEFLNEVEAEALPENDEASNKLKRRMSRLALPNPAFSPFSKRSNELCGKTFNIQSGKLVIENSMFFMTGSVPPTAVKNLSFTASPDAYLMSYACENGLKNTLTIAIDGTRRHNTLVNSELPTSQVLLSGAWVEDNVFALKLRWIETCTERTLHFIVDGDLLTIKEIALTHAFGPFASGFEDIIAKA